MKTALVIDDSSLGRRLAADAMTGLGFKVVQAANGQEGLAAAAEHRPDIIVTDLLMPVMDGQEFLRRFRDSDKRTPVIVLSADIQTSSRESCESLGISGFINKPIKAPVLVACIQSIPKFQRVAAPCTTPQ